MSAPPWGTAPAPCDYCGLSHPQVEASGIYHCPNPLCQGPGAATFRRQLTSYHELDDRTGRHTVDPAEMVAVGLAYADTLSAADPALAAHIRASHGRWLRAHRAGGPP